jgi:hypothetical protein
VVAGWRTLPDQDGPAVAALDRTTGEVAWTVDADALQDAASAGSRPLWVDVLAVGGSEALVTLRPEIDGEEPSTWPGTSPCSTSRTARCAGTPSLEGRPRPQRSRGRRVGRRRGRFRPSGGHHLRSIR